jgi:hypothetical protein
MLKRPGRSFIRLDLSERRHSKRLRRRGHFDRSMDRVKMFILDWEGAHIERVVRVQKERRLLFDIKQRRWRKEGSVKER